jgi:hypothetical protein
MRIFIAVRHANDPREYYGGLWSANFYPALRALGHELVESQTDLLPTSRFMHIPDNFTAEEMACRAETTARILAEVRNAHAQKPIGLFLSYFYNSHFDPAGFAELRRQGIPTVNFYCNSVYQFEQVRDVAKAADFAWHAEKPAREKYLKAGARPIWVQMAADPEVYFPSEGAARRPSACFVGQRYADRDRWVAALVRAGVPLELYGPGWGAPTPTASAQAPAPAAPAPVAYLGRRAEPAGSRGAYVEAVRENLRRGGLIGGAVRTVRQFVYRRQSSRLMPLFAPNARGPIPFQQQKEVFAANEVVLNFANVWADGRPGSALVPHVRLRDFEAPMCRTCYLTGYTEEITEFYEIGKEIDTYRTPEELIEKCRYYLRHPDAAERLREAGFRRARRDHTWVRRFEQLLTAVGLRAAAVRSAV